MKFFQSNKEENKKLISLSVLNSAGVLVYVFLVVLFMSNAQKIFGKNDNLVTGIIVLLIFILSALVTGSLVLGKPAMLYFDGKKKEGVTLLFYTAISLAVILALVVLAYLGLR